LLIEFFKILKNARDIYKDPFTDDGTKKSAKGLIQIQKSQDLKLGFFFFIAIPLTTFLPTLITHYKQLL